MNVFFSKETKQKKNLHFAFLCGRSLVGIFTFSLGNDMNNNKVKEKKSHTHTNQPKDTRTQSIQSKTEIV